MEEEGSIIESISIEGREEGKINRLQGCRNEFDGFDNRLYKPEMFQQQKSDKHVNTLI